MCSVGSLYYCGFIKTFCFSAVENARKRLQESLWTSPYCFVSSQALSLKLHNCLHCFVSTSCDVSSPTWEQWKHTKAKAMQREKMLMCMHVDINIWRAWACLYCTKKNNDTLWPLILQMLACKHICYCDILKWMEHSVDIKCDAVKSPEQIHKYVVVHWFIIDCPAVCHSTMLQTTDVKYGNEMWRTQSCFAFVVLHLYWACALWQTQWEMERKYPYLKLNLLAIAGCV